MGIDSSWFIEDTVFNYHEMQKNFTNSVLIALLFLRLIIL